MLFEIEGIGKNIEQAIENALFELKAVRDDVDIKILDEGGIFRKAKVFVSISEEEREKYQKRQDARKELLKDDEEKEQVLDDVVIEKVVVEEQIVVPKEEKKVEPKKEEPKKEKPAEEEISHDGEVERCVRFIKGLLETKNILAEVKATEDDNDINITIDGVGADILVGYRGETINALQYLVSVYNSKDNRHAKRVRIDINDYRHKREQTLIALANRIAKKVEKTGHSCKLEPMNANERRIIHTALQDNDKVTTFSKGEEPKRYLIVALKKEN